MSTGYPPPPPGNRISPWAWVGIGCGVALLLVVAIVVGIGLFGIRKAKQLEAELKDPAKREARVREVLGAKELPPGYRPFLAFSLPFLVDMAILSDREPDLTGPKGHAFDKQGFVFVRLRVRSGRNDRQKIRDYIEGKSDDVSILHQRGIETTARETIRNGTFDLDGAKVLWVAHRGTIRVEQNRIEGVVSTMSMECADGRARLAFWFTPDPAPGKKVEETDFTGTPADEAAIRKMLGYFTLCR